MLAHVIEQAGKTVRSATYYELRVDGFSGAKPQGFQA
jgi:hypothetical protein